MEEGLGHQNAIDKFHKGHNTNRYMYLNEQRLKLGY